MTKLQNTMKTLQAYKIKTPAGQKTVFYKDGKKYATIPAEQTQPRKGTKVLTVNCFKWAIEWCEPTRVICRKEGNEIFAIFPDGEYSKPYYAGCWAHHEGHGEGDYQHMMSSSYPAADEETKDLIATLEAGYDYVLQIAHRR